MRIIGIDPGLATIGIGLVETRSSQDIKVIEWLIIETKTGNSLPERLREIGDDLATYLKNAQPELAVVEKIYFSKNEKTAIDVAQARGVILQSLAQEHIPIIEPTPPELKSCITGDGSADKKQMQDMLVTLFKLQSPPKPDDAADALALATFGALQKRMAECQM